MAPTLTVVGDGLDPACIEVHDTRFPPGNGSHAWLETTSGQGWCPEAVLRLTNLRGRACQQIRYRSRLSTSDAESGRSCMSFRSQRRSGLHRGARNAAAQGADCVVTGKVGPWSR